MKHAIVFLVALFACGCYAAPPEGLDLIEASIVTTAGHAKDTHGEFSPLAREAFQTDHDAWQKTRKLVYGVDVSPEVQARTDARAAAAKPEGGR